MNLLTESDLISQLLLEHLRNYSYWVQKTSSLVFFCYLHPFSCFSLFFHSVLSRYITKSQVPHLLVINTTVPITQQQLCQNFEKFMYILLMKRVFPSVNFYIKHAESEFLINYFLSNQQKYV